MNCEIPKHIARVLYVICHAIHFHSCGAQGWLVMNHPLYTPPNTVLEYTSITCISKLRSGLDGVVTVAHAGILFHQYSYQP
jgi:hypothetical protein